MKKFLLTALLILSFVGSSFSSDRIILDKLGGKNTRSNPYELQNFEASDISNFTLDIAGSVSERNLFRRYNSVSAGSFPITNVYKFYKTSDLGYLICSGGSNLYNATNGSLNDISVSSSSVVANSNWSFETFTDGTNELVFAANNSIPLKIWNGVNSAFYEGAGSPASNCNILKKHKARLWATGSSAYPYRIYYSSLNNGDNWTTSGGSMDLPSYEKIMAMEVLGDTLFIFTRTSIYAVIGDTPNEFYITRTASKVGTHAYKSVVKGGSLIFFLNKAGVFAFDGSESTNISETIQPTIDSISNTYIGESAGLFDKKGKYWLSFTSLNGSFNDTIVVYDTVVKQWYELDGISLSSFFRADGASDKGELFAGASDPVGYLWQLQSSATLEKISHYTQDQLSTGVTFNTVISSTPTVSLLNGNDTFTKLLIHFNGTNGATSYTTEDYGLRTVTFAGSAIVGTAAKKFGISAGYFPGAAADYITVPYSSDWSFGTGDFTIDFWVRITDSNDEYRFCGQFEDASHFWRFEKRAYNDSGGELEFRWSDEGAGGYFESQGLSWSVNTWYHLAVVRSGNNCYMFRNGESLNVSQIVEFSNLGDFSSVLQIGQQGSSSNLKGWIDEFRISKTARWTSNFNLVDSPPVIEYTKPTAGGSLTSTNLQINASGQSSLGIVEWNEVLPSNTDIQFTTRTGTTNDSVYFNGWESWVSTSTVIDEVTDPSVWSTSDATNFIIQAPTDQQARDILNYETDDSVSPNCVQIIVNGASSTNAYATETIPTKDLTNYKFAGFWLKSPITGDTVVLEAQDITGSTIGYVTASTANINNWEYHYWALTYADKDEVGNLKIKYVGDGSGNIYLGEITAYDFLDSEETITSTPNDWIQYRTVLGSNDITQIPQLKNEGSVVVSLSYSPTIGEEEDGLTSYWTSKIFDNKNNYNKLWNWVEFNLKSQNPTTNHQVKLDYALDDVWRNQRIGYVGVTGNTAKVRFYLPSGSRGKTFQFKFTDDVADDELQILNATIDFQQEMGN